PLDVEYVQLSEAGCIHKSGDNGGQVLIKLPDDKRFTDELRTLLKTDKFIRLNLSANDHSVERILADRGRENQERKKRLRVRLEEMLLDADVYALGQKLDLNRNQLNTRLDEA
ncbi:MAG: hypothetical protein GBQ79_18120, partial [Halomonas sp.]|nr:hypothetical protein [Halomonas sp.]